MLGRTLPINFFRSNLRLSNIGNMITRLDKLETKHGIELNKDEHKHNEDFKYLCTRIDEMERKHSEDIKYIRNKIDEIERKNNDNFKQLVDMIQKLDNQVRNNSLNRNNQLREEFYNSQVWKRNK